MKLTRHLVSLVVMVVHHIAWKHLYTFSRSRALRLGRKRFSRMRTLNLLYPKLRINSKYPTLLIIVLDDTCVLCCIIDELKLTLWALGKCSLNGGFNY